MTDPQFESRIVTLKPNAVDECYQSVKLLLAHVKEQEERIKLLERKVSRLDGENAMRRPLNGMDE